MSFALIHFQLGGICKNKLEEFFKILKNIKDSKFLKLTKEKHGSQLMRYVPEGGTWELKIILFLAWRM